MMRRLLTFILILILSTEIATPKSVGVVMSGGGAKGLYHIGVLEALEEEGIPIDYVAGTSMGAIIAGLYSAGYSPAEMRELAISGQLEEWLSGRISNNYGSLFRRGSTLRNDAPMLSLRIDPNKNTPNPNKPPHDKEWEQKKPQDVKMPKSLISTTLIDLAICDLFTPASIAAGGDYSKLMVPFLCVASDVTADEKVVMTHGDLGESIRASMAIPLAFKPVVTEDGHMLYDGGIQDNFPWRSMVEHFNPDIIIGSACTTDTWTNTNDLSLFDQAFYLAMNETDYSLPENGVMVVRDVPVGMLDFSNAAEIIDMGYNDTKARLISVYYLMDDQPLEPILSYDIRRERYRKQLKPLIFDSYEIEGLEPDQKAYAKKYMSNSTSDRRHGAEIQREMDFDELRKSLLAILSSGDFTSNYPKVTFDPESERYKFAIKLEHKPSLSLSIGGYLSSTPYNQIYIGGKYTTAARVARTLFGELYLGPAYTTGRLGYRADFYHSAPIYADMYYNFSVKNLTLGEVGHISTVTNTVGEKSFDQMLSVGIGAPIKQRAQLILRGNAGIESFNYNSDLLATPPAGVNNIFYKTRLHYLDGKVEIERSTIDNIYMPNRGSHLSLSAMALIGIETSYSRHQEIVEEINNTQIAIHNSTQENRSWIGAKFSAMKYFTFGARNRFSLGSSVEAVYTNFPDLYNNTASQLIMPAYQPISHSQMIFMPEYSAPKYLSVGVMPNVSLWRDLSLRSGVYAMMREKADHESGFTPEVNYILQSSLVYNTSFGPASLSFTKYNLSNWKNMYLTFGFGYAIFAPRGTFY